MCELIYYAHERCHYALDLHFLAIYHNYFFANVLLLAEFL
jgi:hypothetical protein